MKKKTVIITLICALICLTATIIIAYSGLPEVKGADKFNDIGKGKSNAAHNLLNAAENEETVIGTVMGTEITKSYFNFKYDSYKTSPLNYENPKEEAWNAIKREVWEKRFAKEKGIYPSEKEIDEYVSYVRKEYESTQEGTILIKAFCEGMNMTEDEYWRFNRKYEAPLVVTHGKVSEYLEKNKMSMPEAGSIESNITDLEYYNSL